MQSFQIGCLLLITILFPAEPTHKFPTPGMRKVCLPDAAKSAPPSGFSQEPFWSVDSLQHLASTCSLSETITISYYLTLLLWSVLEESRSRYHVSNCYRHGLYLKVAMCWTINPEPIRLLYTIKSPVCLLYYCLCQLAVALSDPKKRAFFSAQWSEILLTGDVKTHLCVL